MPRKKRELRLTLEPGDAALVVKDNGYSELHRQTFPPGREPVNVLVVTAVAMRLAQDATWCREMLEWLDDHRRTDHGLPL